MLELVLAFCVVALLVVAMSVGVIMGRKPLKGSCGGVGAALGEDNRACDICGGSPDKCEAANADRDGRDTDLGYRVE